jgi:hypothetical protein
MRQISRATTAKAAPSVVVVSRRDAMANDFGIGHYCVEPVSSRHSLRARRRSARCPGGVGLVLASIALLLQVAAPILHSPLLVGSAEKTGKFATGFDEHALCLARGRADPGSGTPADQAPQPGDHELAACCFWHGNTTLALVPPTIIEQVAFARSGVAFTSPTEVARPRRAGTTRARAAPVRA